MILQIGGAFLAILAFSVVMEAPRRYLPYCGLVGGVGWFVYLISVDRWGIVMANFFGALAISMISHVFARMFKAPVTVFLIPGILTIVPGAALYRAVYQFFLGTHSVAAEYLLETIQIAGMIALAIFLIDSLFSILQNTISPHFYNRFTTKS